MVLIDTGTLHYDHQRAVHRRLDALCIGVHNSLRGKCFSEFYSRPHAAYGRYCDERAATLAPHQTSTKSEQIVGIKVLGNLGLRIMRSL